MPTVFCVALLRPWSCTTEIFTSRPDPSLCGVENSGNQRFHPTAVNSGILARSTALDYSATSTRTAVTPLDRNLYPTQPTTDARKEHVRLGHHTISAAITAVTTHRSTLCLVYCLALWKIAHQDRSRSMWIATDQYISKKLCSVHRQITVAATAAARTFLSA